MVIPAGPINGTYDPADIKDIFGAPLRPLRQGHGNQTGNKLYINGQLCNLSASQTSATSSDLTYTISGYTGEATTIPSLGTAVGINETCKIAVI